MELGALPAGGAEEGADLLVLLVDAAVEQLDVDADVLRRLAALVADLELELQLGLGVGEGGALRPERQLEPGPRNWVRARQAAALDGSKVDPEFAAMKRPAARFYLDQIVPEARGLASAAMAPATALYSVSEEAFAAA